MASSSVARAENSCRRCHRRKKRCDKTLPQCDACRHAQVACSFLDDHAQVASFPIAYVRGLELRVKELEQQLADRPSSDNGDLVSIWPENPAVGNTRVENNSPIHQQENPSPVSRPRSRQGTESLAEELKVLSLEATADRHLGPSSGISFAKLTQAVLRRLSPGREAFVFEDGADEDETVEQQQRAMTDLWPDVGSSLLNIDPALISPLVDAYKDPVDISLLDASHISYLLEFYFAHSHTLYPIIRQTEFTSVLWRLYADPLDPLAQSPLWQFRIWMVLAIGSTAYSSVTLVDESESVQFFQKAMTYFEAVMGCGYLAGLEALMLQVSYSFFNKIGPNTWFLVGLAARMAIGMGLHTADTYRSLAIDVAEYQKRLFFSLYMMDRVVSMALGRPFAIHDDDINVEPFSTADDEHIKPEGITLRSSLEPSRMAVPLHILDLRKIASDIGSHVHSIKRGDRLQTAAEKEETIQALHRRLIEWRRSMPFPLPDLQSNVPHLCTNWFDLNYYTHLIMLYRPSSLCPTLDLHKVKILAEASAMAIRQAITMHRQHRFSYNWLNLFGVFNSALSLMYATTSQPDHLALVLDRTKAIADLQLVIELLDTFAKKFPSAKRIRRMVQDVVAKLQLYAVEHNGRTN
ncbi:hypothetical protein ASPZODRAFT_13499 [Penicilliopsis zonata CBS 506.65]|uniref:Zn(2)-C6 fungal-type domain-containing protein n=1 Tax=Penicilliopsis zonata CBS 506.65 TaxID=1073090 RepID=A0A1L9ST93_9EURO|nr:hypothetical protein ASPZODRAFT_13499 [Penicilliopsis zonata CBS 506.65]OJJ50419.1 hypothetical protein ASPZODRAFT_13499 [Penicilliopsis zonata CBS 506.65]